MNLMADLGSVLPISRELLDTLSRLDSFRLQSSLLIDLSIIANIPDNLLGESNYGEIAVTSLVNSFEATASFGSEGFSFELPISLPSTPEIMSFNVTEASFSRDIFVRTLDPIDVIQLFPHDQNSTSDSLEYAGSFEAFFPMNVGLVGINTGIDLNISDPDLFKPNPVVDYAINMCDLSDTIMDLFDQLKVKIVEAVRAPFGDKPVTFDVDRLLG